MVVLVEVEVVEAEVAVEVEVVVVVAVAADVVEADVGVDEPSASFAEVYFCCWKKELIFVGCYGPSTKPVKCQVVRIGSPSG